MKYLGVDWGLKKVGLAVSEGNLASPLMTIEINGLKEGVEKVIGEAKKENADLLIIGLPEGEMGKNVKKAAGELEKAGMRIELVDETLSTHNAQQIMQETGVGQKGRRDDNKVAAAIILQNFLDDLV